MYIYEVFLDEVKPQDLSLSFLREFMDLPTSYFAAGAPLKYQDFIQRWGTHYIKSSKFGGQLQIRKFMDASDVSSKKEFAVEMEMEYKSLFASVGAKSSTTGGEYSRNQSKTTSTTIIALGGSHEVASILSDAYSPTFKSAFKEWLVSIPKYPKPFLFQVSSITDLVNFRMRDLFPGEKVDWGCEGHAASLTTETNANGDRVTFFQTVADNGTTVKHYCTFDSRKGLEEAIKRRRISLKRAIEIYMEEGPTSISDFSLPECTLPEPSGTPSQSQPQKRAVTPAPTWQKITSGQKEFRVIFDMKKDLAGIEEYNITRNMSRLVKYTDGKWLTGEGDGSFHLYNAFNNGGSGDAKRRKMSVLGLVLSYNQKTGGLELLPEDFKASKQFFPNLPQFLTGRALAKIAMESDDAIELASKRESQTMVKQPCNVKWSNALRFDPTDSDGKCLHFTATTEGSLFVVFSTLPKDKSSWYYTEITPERVAIYKGGLLATSTTNPNARGLGDPSLLQSYFVCVTESENTTLIEYGKTLGSTDSGDIYLNMLDTTDRLNVRFYAFANGDKKLDVIDAHIVSRNLTKADCKGDTHMDLETRLCTQKCHEDCDPLHGCNTAASGNPLPEECNVCRIARDLATGKCVPDCKEPNFLSPNKLCVDKSGTFDVEPGRWQTVEDSLTVRQIPHLPALTMCLWLRFKDLVDSMAWQMVKYTVTGSRYQQLYLMWSRFGNQKELLVHQRAWTGASHLVMDRITSENYLDDNNWHHYCISFSGESGIFTQYKDGIKSKAEAGIAVEYDGGGVLQVGQKFEQAYQITGFNLWNRVLPSEEITGLATSCLKGIGNVKHWFDFSDSAKAISSMKVIAPSVCHPPAQRRTVEEPEEPTA